VLEVSSEPREWERCSLKSTDGEAGLELWHDVVIKRKAKKGSPQAAFFSSIEKEMAVSPHGQIRPEKGNQGTITKRWTRLR